MLKIMFAGLLLISAVLLTAARCDGDGGGGGGYGLGATGSVIEVVYAR